MPKIGSVHWKEFEKFLLQVGCEFKREKGDHRIYTKRGLPRPIVVPRDTQLPPFIILSNLRTLDVSRGEYFEILATISKKKRKK